MTLDQFRRKYGTGGLTFRLMVSRYIEKTAGADPELALAIMLALDELRGALNQRHTVAIDEEGR